MRLSAAAAGTALAAGAGSKAGLNPVGNAQAIPPIAIGAAAVGGSAAVGWALREYEVAGSDDPPEGLTPEVLHERVYDIVRTRQSTNGSSFTDNRNILEGIEHTAFADGKIAAIEALNDPQSQDEVYNAAEQAADEYATTVMKNFLQGWNESLNELGNLINTLEEHPETDVEGTLVATRQSNADFPDYNYSDPPEIDDEEREIELPDGSFDVERVRREGEPRSWDPAKHDGSSLGTQDGWVYCSISDEDDVHYLRFTEWNEIYEEMVQLFTDVRSGLSLWVEEVYDSVQAGELDTEELLTPRELAEMTADEEDFNQAISDLMALNVSVDLEREAEVHIPELDATVYGQIAKTGSGSLSTGTVNPDEEDEDFYLTYDVSEGSGDWGAHETGIDGGTITFTSEPWEETVYHVHTVAGETAEILASDFEHDEEEDEWTYNASNQLDDAISDIEDVEYFASTEETQYETVRLTGPFEIITFTDSDGNEHDEADFTRSETQTDDNYITEEEWKEQQERHEELIEQYEDAQSGGGIDLGGLGGWFSGVGQTAAAAGAGVLALIFAGIALGGE
ncbi:hypothetical protein [Natronomonas pharaonis]|uniref:hypothetical protein n=1 Tax=Natronomonas pharaonis TaxID=2257 RepID=UPI0011D1585D|nr:hypothetical protein [Natronomonas pharaonis]